MSQESSRYKGFCYSFFARAYQLELVPNVVSLCINYHCALVTKTANTDCICSFWQSLNSIDYVTIRHLNSLITRFIIKLLGFDGTQFYFNGN